MPDELKIIIIKQMSDILFAAGKKVINTDNIISLDQ